MKKTAISVVGLLLGKMWLNLVERALMIVFQILSLQFSVTFRKHFSLVSFFTKVDDLLVSPNPVFLTHCILPSYEIEFILCSFFSFYIALQRDWIKNLRN